uniref:Transcription repressor n=1 Tax=Kalanchoe fedtschenkoi TaxID=63787 RepID=A0A7N0VBA9_KALFE
MLLNPLSSSPGSWEIISSTSNDQDDEAEEAYTSITFFLTSAASSHEKSDNHHPNTPCKGGPPQAVLGDSIAVEKQSVNPYSDFQQSILQMIFQRRIDSKSDLQELLNCFVQLNTPLHHQTIIKAFIDLLNNVANHATHNIVICHLSKSTPDPQMSKEQIKHRTW